MSGRESHFTCLPGKFLKDRMKASSCLFLWNFSFQDYLNRKVSNQQPSDPGKLKSKRPFWGQTQRSVRDNCFFFPTASNKAGKPLSAWQQHHVTYSRVIHLYVRPYTSPAHNHDNIHHKSKLESSQLAVERPRCPLKLVLFRCPVVGFLHHWLEADLTRLSCCNHRLAEGNIPVVKKP